MRKAESGHPGPGARVAEEVDKQLRKELQRILEETTAGNPMSALR